MIVSVYFSVMLRFAAFSVKLLRKYKAIMVPLFWILSNYAVCLVFLIILAVVYGKVAAWRGK